METINDVKFTQETIQKVGEKLIRAHGAKCFNCGRKSKMVGLFIPDKDFPFQPKNKKRTIAYLVCKKCATQKAADEISSKIINQYYKEMGAI